MRIKVLHIITGLGNGGAERNLYKLCKNINQDKFETLVVSLRNNGSYGEMLSDIGIKCYYANLGTMNLFKNLINLYKFIHNQKPDIIQTWLYHADFIGLLIGKMAGIRNLVWNIRSTQLNFKNNSWHVVIIRKICALLSFIPDKIVNCSRVSIEEHVKIRYRQNKFIFIPNGYNPDDFYPDDKLSLYSKDDKIILGFVGRNHPQKSLFSFLEALRIIKTAGASYKAIIAGLNTDNFAVKDFIRKNQLDNVILLGQRNDIINIYNSIDIFVLSSQSEAFPNVVAEAMLCGKPCVVTDVGDAAYIVGDTGMIIPSADSTKLADGIMHLAQLGREHLMNKGKSARERAVQNFGLSKMIDSYEQLYIDIMKKVKV